VAERELIVITAAGGRLGRELTAHLAAKRVRLRLVGLTVRPWFAGHETVIGDLFNPLVMKRAVEGATAIVHLAEVRPNRDLIARIGPVGYDKQMFHVNLEGTRRLALMARDAGVGRFLYASGESVYGPPPRECPCTEATPPAPNGPYGRSKLEAEYVLNELHRSGDLEVVVLRFATILGRFPANIAMVNRLFRLALRHLPIPLTQSGSTLKHCVHRRDAVDAIERALTRPQASGRTYNVAGAGAATVAEIFDAVTDALDSHSVPIPLPRLALPVINAVTTWIGDPFILPEFARSALEHTCYSTGRALAELGFRPKYDTLQAFLEAAAWYRDHAGEQ